MMPIPLCPHSHSGYSMPNEIARGANDRTFEYANHLLRDSLSKRAELTASEEDPGLFEVDIDPFIQKLQKRWNLLTPAQSMFISSLGQPYAASLVPLDQCILDIFCEAYDSPLSRSVIGNGGDLIMLRAAAIYQAKTETVSCFSPCQSLTNEGKGPIDCSILDLPPKLSRNPANQSIC